MDTHCKVDLSTQQIVEKCGIPADLAGLPAEVLADPAAHLQPCPPQHDGVGYWPVLYAVPPYDPATQRLSSEQTVDEVDGANHLVRACPAVVELTPGDLHARLTELRAARKAAATALRWERECGGIVIGGVPVATDDRSKTLILGKRAKARENPEMTFRWKAAGGNWIDLTGSQIIAIADAVADHVQACFDREGELHDLIDAAGPDAAAVLAVDIAAGWP